MRLIVFFDLPVATAKQRKDYRLFRKYLTKDGYLMLQESVYAKLVINDAAAGAAIARLRKNRRQRGWSKSSRLARRRSLPWNT